jgi:hypothetical protein
VAELGTVARALLAIGRDVGSDHELADLRRRGVEQPGVSALIFLGCVPIPAGSLQSPAAPLLAIHRPSTLATAMPMTPGADVRLVHLLGSRSSSLTVWPLVAVLLPKAWDACGLCWHVQADDGPVARTPLSMSRL